MTKNKKAKKLKLINGWNKSYPKLFTDKIAKQERHKLDRAKSRKLSPQRIAY